MKKAWEKKANQVKIISIAMVCMGILSLLIAFSYAYQAIKVKGSSGYTWGDLVELTNINDTDQVYAWDVFFIEVTLRKALSSIGHFTICKISFPFRQLTGVVRQETKWLTNSMARNMKKHLPIKKNGGLS